VSHSHLDSVPAILHNFRVWDTPLAQDYWASPEHVRNYLAKAPSLPHRHEGDEALLDRVPADARRILDLGTGNGHLLGLLRRQFPECVCVGVDVSVHMLNAARTRFRHHKRIDFRHHDLNEPLSGLGQFDVVVTSFATHNLEVRRQMSLYAEVFELLRPGGVFCNLEHVPSPTADLHKYFYKALGEAADCFNNIEDKPTALSTHLRWLRELEFGNVDCYWQWLEMALIVGTKRAVFSNGASRNPQLKIDQYPSVL
jgi:tRNA (cmo5U34)-methyltransferase